ncbi:MAG TPA: hypothetical protein ENJ40_00090 [Thermosulfurimonas dismutans]|uniref:Uncharacterized protein n=1 Tax=Thermosulfurimonas dismutans TaxID=999894 RepID=A0A7C3GSP7_9BACT|nr:hypothetical protein [Thermosulfurimonas dismutans]
MVRVESFSLIDVTDMLLIGISPNYLPGGDRAIEIVEGSLEDALSWDVDRYFRFRTTFSLGLVVNFSFRKLDDFLSFVPLGEVPVFAQLYLIAGAGDPQPNSSDRSRNFNSPTQFRFSPDWYEWPLPPSCSIGWAPARGVVSFGPTEYNVVKMAGSSFLAPVIRKNAFLSLSQETPGMQPGEKYEFYIFLLRVFLWIPKYYTL